MFEVRREPQVIRMANAEAMDVQRQAFQFEPDKVREKLELVELRSETLTGELRKVIKVTQDERPAKITSTGNKVLTTNDIETEGEKKFRQTQDQGSTSSTPIPFNSVGISRVEN